MNMRGSYKLRVFSYCDRDHFRCVYVYETIQLTYHETYQVYYLVVFSVFTKILVFTGRGCATATTNYRNNVLFKERKGSIKEWTV